MATSSSERTTAADAGRPFDWWRTLGPKGRRAFGGAAGGWGLDAYDVQVLPLGLTALSAALAITKFEAGLLQTVTLVVSALGGMLAGVLCDRIGRTRTLVLTVSTYALFTVLCGFAPNYETLVAFRALQGLGFGGEWAAGAVLVAEYAHTRYRGRTMAFIQSMWAVGWGLAVVAYTIVFSFVSEDMAWRVLFWTGALPALLILYIRRNVSDAPITKQVEKQPRSRLIALWGRDHWRTTLFASLLATGAQGGYYTLTTWLPSFLKEERGLTVIGTGGNLLFLITGAFAGYVSAGYVADLLGRKWTFTIFAAMSGILLLVYTRIPADTGELAVLLVGVPLGFFSSGIFSGFGSFLAELYPTALRGTGQGFTYNIGRAAGAGFPALVGFFAAQMGVGGAMTFGVLAYGIAVLALLGLPETRGNDLPSGAAPPPPAHRDASRRHSSEN